MTTSLLAGLGLGLPAGLSPGPMLTLVVTQTLRHGPREGLKVAMAPLFSDAPIILFSLWVLGQISSTRSVMGVISLAGAAFLIYLAFECFRTRRIESGGAISPPRSLGMGVAANLLNPHPYLFWFSVGSPLLLEFWRAGVADAGAFLAGFYVCLVGSKVLVAVLMGRGRTLLTDKLYAWLMSAMAAVLLIFAALFVREGIPALLVK